MQINFIESLMDHIMEATMIPKAQVERAVGPILSMFLADVLTETLADDPHLSGPIAMICPEFPLKKAHNRQSTNIDWLMHHENRGILLFVELKTSDTSVNESQNAIYHEHIRQVQARGGGFLVQDVEALRDASNESGKYQYLLEERITPFRDQIAASRAASLVYLVPKSAQNRVQDHADRVITFSELSANIQSPYAREWAVIHDRLSQLDQISRRSRNLNYRGIQTDQTGYTALSRINFKGKISLNEIFDLCKAYGDAIVVGFSGGRNALENSSLAYLEQRLYKWDEVKQRTGVKNFQNWVPGGTFVWVIERKTARQGQAIQGPVREKVSRSVNWSGTCKFDEMVQLCQENGNNILIGFTGGKTAFADTTLEKLRNRPHYKWDWSSSTAKRNIADWLPGGTVLALLRQAHKCQV
ncbi:MAG: hypothetical protein K0B06_04095 [Brevefilum sp.]|nr:hypothetical protein [Brevefilum sp.]